MRAAVVVVDGGKVALIERRRAGLRYFLFPGGGVEDGETAEQAARREAREELGLDVVLGPHIATVVYGGNEQLYFAAEPGEGAFGTGGGEEMTGEDFEGHGSYVPTWLAVEELSDFDVRPRAIVDLILTSRSSGWTTSAITVQE